MRVWYGSTTKSRLIKGGKMTYASHHCMTLAAAVQLHCSMLSCLLLLNSWLLPGIQ